MRLHYPLLFPRLVFAVRIVMCAWSAPAEAHSMYQSAVLLDFRGNTVQAELQLPVDRLSISFRQPVDASHFAEEQSALQSYVLAHVHPVSSDGRPFSVSWISMNIQTVEKAPYVVVHLSLGPPSGAKVDLFTLNYDVIAHEIVTHVVLVSIRSDSQAHIPPADPILVGIIRAGQKSVVIDRMRII
jgi:hypothetical protein